MSEKRLIYADDLMNCMTSSFQLALRDGCDSDIYRLVEEVIEDAPTVPAVVLPCKAYELVIAERKRQNEKWGAESSNHPFEWMSILGEEYGELCEAVNESYFVAGEHPEKGGRENIIKEAVQVAAVAIAIVEQIQREEAEAALRRADG